MLRAKKKRERERGGGIWLVCAQGCPLVAKMRMLPPTDALSPLQRAVFLKVVDDDNFPGCRRVIHGEARNTR